MKSDHFTRSSLNETWKGRLGYKSGDPEFNEVTDAFGTLSGIILNIYLAILG